MGEELEILKRVIEETVTNLKSLENQYALKQAETYELEISVTQKDILLSNKEEEISVLNNKILHLDNQLNENQSNSSQIIQLEVSFFQLELFDTITRIKLNNLKKKKKIYYNQLKNQLRKQKKKRKIPRKF